MKPEPGKPLAIKWFLLMPAVVLFLCGCPPDKTPNPTPSTNNPPPATATNSLPSAFDVFTGNQNFRTDPSGTPNIWATINLTQTRDADQAQEIRVWVNTTGVTGSRTNGEIHCDQIQLVDDDTAHTLLSSGDMFRQEMENAPDGANDQTYGTCLAKGDYFDLGGNTNEFQLLRKCLVNARILVRLVNKQPNGSAFHVDSIKVQATR